MENYSVLKSNQSWCERNNLDLDELLQEVSIMGANEVPYHATSTSEQVRYNPRVNPFWMDSEGNNIDGKSFDVLFTNGRNIYNEVQNI